VALNLEARLAQCGESPVSPPKSVMNPGFHHLANVAPTRMESLPL
jgi:hypothetical protein